MPAKWLKPHRAQPAAQTDISDDIGNKISDSSTTAPQVPKPETHVPVVAYFYRIQYLSCYGNRLERVAVDVATSPPTLLGPVEIVGKEDLYQLIEGHLSTEISIHAKDIRLPKDKI